MIGSILGSPHHLLQWKRQRRIDPQCGACGFAHFGRVMSRPFSLFLVFSLKKLSSPY